MATTNAEKQAAYRFRNQECMDIVHLRLLDIYKMADRDDSKELKFSLFAEQALAMLKHVHKRYRDE